MQLETRTSMICAPSFSPQPVWSHLFFHAPLCHPSSLGPFLFYYHLSHHSLGIYSLLTITFNDEC
ncbi:hypothetical protein HBH70_055500 [Parastagonospora nodorum]|nr:hypothetical protein HBH47_032600 [Parastagonospora nodorum]KAH4225625.1 hypothetical protein HBI06_113870 [Parastagonospora nodorum]KAH4247232.1 hypothetical protein HBI05_042570 [Parastagonospora nodorum]KAH4809655.1 hypothetical protein HBH61_105710 [Parastagonospora nodorum]KAH5029307.1 hypothetical protein HBI74_107040 [Parastagonospora nodorum]